MTGKEKIAKNFVDTQTDIGRLSTGAAFTKNPVERNLRDKLVDALKERNALRLLFLTGNLKDNEYEIKATKVDAEVENLEGLVWIK